MTAAARLRPAEVVALSFLQAWGGFALLHALLRARLAGASILVAWLGVAAVLGLELLTWRRVERVALPRRRAVLALVGHATFWVVLYVAWVEVPVLASGTKEYLKSHLAHFFGFATIFLYDLAWPLAALLPVYAVAVHRGLVRRGRLRWTLCFVVPVLTVFLASVLFYLVPRRDVARIAESGGEVVFSLEGRLPAEAWYARGIYDLARSPRGLVVDEAAGTIDAAYGSSVHCWREALGYPSLFRVSLADGAWRALNLSTVKGLDLTPGGDRLFAAGWNAEQLYEVARGPFELARTVDLHAVGLRHGLPYTSPLELVLDPGRRAVFVAIELHALLRYDLDSGQSRLVDFAGRPGVPAGTMTWGLNRDAVTGLLYLRMFGSAMQLAELDPDTLQVLREAKAPGELGALALDGDRRVAYATALFSTDLWRLDLDTLEVRELGHVPINSRTLLLDPDRGLLYALGYNGDLHVLDPARGVTLRTHFVGPKASALALTGRALYAHSAAGVVRLPL